VLKNRIGRYLGLTLAATALSGSAHAAPKKKRSTAADRTGIAITVYNQNFGLVREERRIRSGTGQVALQLQDVAARIRPETVHIKGQGLRVLEQNYRFDLLTPETLLKKHVGKAVRVHRYNEKLGREDSFDAKLLSVAGGKPVLQIGKEVTFDFPGRISFPGVPANLMARPTLVWLLDSQRAEQKVEVTYLTQGMTWKTDYVLVLDSKESKGDLTGWVTLNNQSGASYTDARLKLVAGDVNQVRPRGGEHFSAGGMATAPAAPPRIKEESFFEYHLYTLNEPTDVLDNEQKQVTLLEAKGMRLEKKLIFYGQPYWFRGRHGQTQSNQKVGVYLDITNSKKNGLGMPLPKGVVRVYKADKSGAQQFVGEDNIDHTPRDEKVRIKMGEAFDVVGERKQVDYRRLGMCGSETSWEIQIRNHKKTAVKVEDYEPVGGEWTIVDSSHPHKKKDARTFTFEVKVPANGKTTIKYRVRIRWC